MAKKLSRLQIAQQKTEVAAKRTNEKINELGEHASSLYTSLNTIQSLFDRIRNVPEESIVKYKKLKAIRVKWKQQAEKIEMEYKKAEMKAAGQGAAGVGALTVGGGGMAAGKALLTLAGPVGWTLAGITLFASGVMFFKTKSDKQRLENIFTLISKRDIKSYELAIVELSERIKRITIKGEKPTPSGVGWIAHT